MLDVLVVTGYIYHLLAALVHDCACIQRLHFTDKLTLTAVCSYQCHRIFFGKSEESVSESIRNRNR